jgi:uncharacterized protein (DUF1501 family)
MPTHHSRRDWLRFAGAITGLSSSSWLRAFAAEAARNPQRKRSCILLWMSGGPSQTDTFDLKPGHANGGPVKEIDTAVPGIRIAEHLPQLAAQMKHLALVRSMSTKEGDHGRATFLLRTGNLPVGAIEFPALGSLVAKELAREQADLPSYISIAPQRAVSQAAYSPGFLGPQFAPLFVADGAGFVAAPALDDLLKVQDLEPAKAVRRERMDGRLDLLKDLESDFLGARPGVAVASHRAAYEQAERLMRSQSARAFNVNEEPEKLRDRYGRNLFGQGCLLARRLIERGVPFVEVSLANVPNGNWDSHNDNFNQVKNLCSVLDPAWSTLMEDLSDRGLLDTTMVIWMGEFGRTPKLNQQKGRDHFPNAWSVVVGGAGIRGGQVVGKTSKDGMTVEERPTSVPDLLATVCMGLGIDPGKSNLSNVDRPIRIVDRSARPIMEIIG